MVLQQQQEILLFGKATPSEQVVGSFKGEVRKTNANPDGSWRLVFSPSKAGGPYNLKLSGNNTIEFNNIFVVKYGSVRGSQIWDGHSTNQKMV